MTNLINYLPLEHSQQEHLTDVERRYRQFYNEPDKSRPMFILNPPVAGLPTWEERLADPWVMLRSELDLLRPHFELQDDRVATVRVQFGTAQIAAAFGCEMFIPPNNLPAAGNHILKNVGDIYSVKMPDLSAGWYGKLAEWTRLWLEQLPEGIAIQLPDLQSAFNSAHLIRGNDILTDFFDQPAALERLLDVVTDYMIEQTRELRKLIKAQEGWFYDWGALWPGAARISNCSMHMISPRFYRDYVMPRDRRFFNAVGGGRMHYCGTAGKVIDDFFTVPNIYGLDYDSVHHDLWDLSRRAPAHVTLLHNLWSWNEEAQNLVERLVQGDFPPRRNLIFSLAVPSLEDGKRLLERLRNAADRVFD